MEVTYCSTYGDLLRCTVYSVTHRRELMFILAFYIGCATLTEAHHFRHVGWVRFPIAVFLMTFLVCLIMFITLNLLVLFRLSKPKIQRRCTSILNSECLTDKTQHKTKQVLWSAISEIRYHQGDIFFWQKAKDGIFVPRSTFESREQSQLFYEIAVKFWNAAKSDQHFASVQDSTIWPPPPRLQG